MEAEDDKVTIREMREIENDDKNKIQKLTDSNGKFLLIQRSRFQIFHINSLLILNQFLIQ